MHLDRYQGLHRDVQQRHTAILAACMWVTLFGGHSLISYALLLHSYLKTCSKKVFFFFRKQTNKQQQRRSDQMLYMCQKDNLTRGLRGHGLKCSQVTSQITLPAFILHHFSDPLLPLDILCFHLT